MEAQIDATGLLRREGGRWLFSDARPSAADLGRIGTWPLRLKEEKGTGRFVVADRDISAGELLFSEEPFVQTVHDRCERTVCHVCYAPLTAVKQHGCQSCGQVRYCSKPCASAGAAAHEAECGVLAAIAESGNVAMQSGVRGLRLFMRLLHRAANEPSAFAAVEAMRGQYDEETPERRRFWDGMSSSINRFVPPEVRMEAGRLARLASRVHANLYGVGDIGGVQFGSGLYAQAGSLFNHSCAPSAAVSFAGRTWRLHALRVISRGEEVCVSYTTLYASREARREALRAKKGFWCVCQRCVAPPRVDAMLDGWRCVAEGCDDGVVSAASDCCAVCRTRHSLAPAARAAIEARWLAAVEESDAALLGDAATATGGDDDMAAAARRALPAMERVLSASAGRLCDGHALRHRARMLRCYAQSALGGGVAAKDAAAALRECLVSMERHLPSRHPETSFVRHRLASELWRLAVESTDSERAETRREAHLEALAAAKALGTAYGGDHPTVRQWREDAARMAGASYQRRKL